MSTVSAVTASGIQADYMKLLVTQLQNQNPLEPLDNNEMASQLAQFSQLQQLETMNSSFAKVLEFVEQNYASSLLGKKVSFLCETESGTLEVQEGTVESFVNNAGGEILLEVGGTTIALEDVLSVKQ